MSTKIQANGSEIEILPNGDIKIVSAAKVTLCSGDKIEEKENVKDMVVSDCVDEFSFDAYLQLVELASKKTEDVVGVGARLHIESIVFSGNKKIGTLKLDMPVEPDNKLYEKCRRNMNHRMSGVDNILKIKLNVK